MSRRGISPFEPYHNASSALYDIVVSDSTCTDPCDYSHSQLLNSSITRFFFFLRLPAKKKTFFWHPIRWKYTIFTGKIVPGLGIGFYFAYIGLSVLSVFYANRYIGIGFYRFFFAKPIYRYRFLSVFFAKPIYRYRFLSVFFGKPIYRIGFYRFFSQNR